jgi:acetyl-CoA acetyltransferase
MPEAVIVAAARTPIGRAFKGSLKDLRPDDLAAFIIKTALQEVPQLDPEDIDDLMQFHDKQFGLETMCVGGGQGMALVLERLS